MEYAIENNAGTIALIKEEYEKNDLPWFIGFSGGKDSSAVLKLTFLALTQINKPRKPITIIYCDTGVDIPIINELVINTLCNIEKEAKDFCIPISIKTVSPPAQDKYFSKVIGKGYPTPTNIFRWCTDRLRINPINTYFNINGNKDRVILLGIRNGESVERDKVISFHQTDKQNYYRQSGSASTSIFAPIIDYSTEEVWATVAYNTIPKGIDAISLMKLYRQASGECPIIRDPKGTPCGKGRFGCWVCTVVRKDKSITSLVNEGYSRLKPLLDFRNWLFTIRDDYSYRFSKRRNGSNGPGPFTLNARQEILNRLIETQNQSGYSLIDQSQLEYIYGCWETDVNIITE